MTTKAIIYCRVSSDRQVKEGHGLDSQEKLCRNYAIYNKYEVVGVFREEGESGGLFDRPAMKDLINFLEVHRDDNKENKIVVIFDDLKRFARDVQIHFKLKQEIEGRNGKVESPNFKFENTSFGKFVETVAAAQAELERNQNKEVVVRRMKARLELGYWAFFPPLAMKNYIHPERGRILGYVEPQATIIKTAIEQFRDRVLLTIDDVMRYLNNQYINHGINDSVSRTSARRILSQILYAGYIEYKPWGVPLQKAKHDGIISMETYQKVRERFAGKEKTNIRKDYSLDFPLRNLTLCSVCDKPLTASWVKGRSKKYPTYWCKTDGCPMRYKSISKHDIETKFAELLLNKKLDKNTSELTCVVLNDVWNQNKEGYSLTLEENRRQLLKLNNQIVQSKDLIRNTTKKELRPIYENDLVDLLKKQADFETTPQKNKYTSEEFGTASKTVFSVLENPVSMWQSDQFQDKRTIVYMFFEEKLAYDRVNGFGTARLAPAVELISQYDGNENRLVEMEGLNPRVKNTF